MNIQNKISNTYKKDLKIEEMSDADIPNDELKKKIYHDNDNHNHDQDDDDDECDDNDCELDHDDDDSDAEIINITQNPLYHILGAYLENEKGVNIADILSSIKRSIDRNTQTLRSVEELLIKNNK